MAGAGEGEGVKVGKALSSFAVLNPADRYGEEQLWYRRTGGHAIEGAFQEHAEPCLIAKLLPRRAAHDVDVGMDVDRAGQGRAGQAEVVAECGSGSDGGS